jgi:branched-chain amino acid aminotransferase
VIGLYPNAKKSCDVFSNIKNNNYLQYAMAALWSKENKLNDALLLNSNNNIADSCIANVFIIKNGIIKTPALREGCVAGVMRQYLIEILKQNDIEVVETSINTEDIANADEVFLTNVIKGIMWVRQFGDSNYAYFETKKIYKTIFK